MELAGKYGISLIKYVFGIVIGISLVWATIHAAGKIIKKFKFTHKTC
jgi:hypothetical protein